MAILTFLNRSEFWTLTKQQENQFETAEMSFLRTVAGYRKGDRVRNQEIRQELVKLYPQQNS
jgi:hypothetical protein